MSTLSWHYANWNHVLLKNPAVRCRVEHAKLNPSDPDIAVGTVVSDGKGRWHYPVPAGVALVRLRVTVADPSATANPPLASVDQTFAVAANATSSAGVYGQWHPRVLSYKAVSAGLWEADLDFTFLDVTDFALSLSTPCEKPRPLTTAAMLKDFYATNHYGAATRVYEYTAGRPATWVVVLPRSVLVPRRDDDKPAPISVCYFFRPAGPSYKDLSDVQLHPMFRYIAEGQDPRSGFFWLREDAAFYWSLGKSTDFVVHFTPPCSYERQVTEAQKQVILACPLPHGSNFGDAVTSSARLADALVRTAHARAVDDKGIEAKTPVWRNRIALAGFSFGGGVALQALRRNGLHVSEIYLFDPAQYTDAEVKYLARWLAANRQRKARLVRADLWAANEAIARVLGYKPRTAKERTWAEPQSDDYFYLDALYSGSLVPPFFPGPRFVPQSGHRASTPQVAFSQLDTDVDLDAIPIGDPKAMSPRSFMLLAPAVQNASLQMPGVSRYELIPMIFRHARLLPINSTAAWNSLSQVILNDFHYRHQWAALGGFDLREKLGDYEALNGSRQADFRGYLQSAVEDSFL
jgi:hypothetical protein